MNEQIIRHILEHRAQNPNTRKAYMATYNKMAKFEQRTGKSFEHIDERILFDFIADPVSKYADATTVSSALPQIKCYLREIGWGAQIDDLSCRDFDISNAMRAALIGSLEEMYQRGVMIYTPENGDAFFPLVSMAWMGVSAQEALLLSENDVDLENGQIRSNSALIFDRMPAIMIQVLKSYRDTTQSDKGNGQIKLPDRIGYFIYKNSFAGSSSAGKALDKSTYAYFFAAVRDKYNETHDLQTHTTYGDVIQSAKYYKVRQAELSGVDWQHQKNGEYLQTMFNTKRIEPAYLRYNYAMYKKAFGLK